MMRRGARRWGVGMVALEEIELPANGKHVPFERAGDSYWIRADNDHAWTLLGPASGGVRKVMLELTTKSGAYWKIEGDVIEGPFEDWRKVIRSEID